jgi:transcriptional regulator with XRE-family HTH domain
LTPLASGWHLLGAQIRHWRLVRGLSQAQLGALTHDSSALIAKVEKAVRRPNQELIHRIDTALDAGGVLEELWVAANRTRSTGDTGPAPRLPETVIPPTVARVGEAEVEGMSVMAQAFADADHRSGGGHVRAALEHYLAATVRPILARDCPASLRGAMLTAAGRVLDIAGFTAFDSGDQDLARTRYREALDLLDVAGAAALSGHVLTDLAMLAVHEKQPSVARDHAEAAAQANRSAGSDLGQARALAVLARAHVLTGDVTEAQQALGHAEELLHGADMLSEPQWVRFFTHEQLAAERAYAFHRHVHPDRIAELTAAAGATGDGMHRRRMLVTLTLAASYLAPRDPSHRDPDRAAGLLIDAVTGAGTLASARTLALIDQLRRGIRAHGSPATVRAVEDVVRHSRGVRALRELAAWRSPRRPRTCSAPCASHRRAGLDVHGAA